MINGLVIFFAYMGIIENNTGFLNVLKFLIVFNFIVSGAILGIKEVREKAYKRGAAIPPKLNLIYGIIFACVLVYYGFIVLGILDFLATFFQVGIYTKNDEGV